jgi:16S rRNA (guanine527-N7)-methyltransferase
MRDDLLEGLVAGGRDLGVDLQPEQAEKLLKYLALLSQWGRVYNLTAIRDPQEGLTQHLLDCLAVVPALRAHRPQGGRLLDVGSGAGLPGVVIATVCPEWQVTCVDTVAKKMAFVQQAAGQLGLVGFSAVHARVESLPGPFDVITARAFAALPDLVSWSSQALAPEGVWMAMKGRDPVEERAALPSQIDVFHVEPLRVPGLVAERCLVWMRLRKQAG